MRYRNLGKSGLKLSELSFGSWVTFNKQVDSKLAEEMFESLRKKVVKLGGYMTMIKNSDYLPYVEDVFTINRERFNLSQNIKKSFDPKGILNPGKMYTGI